MPFSDDFGLIFNCGFCRTFVLECSANQSDCGKKRTTGRKKKSENVVRSGLSVLFQSWFNGPRFTVRCNYFCKHGKQQLSLFDRHCQQLYTAWKNPFRSKGFTKEDYVSTFSSVSWDSLSKLEKSSHSISKCFACAKMYANLQRSFPLSSTFEPDSSVIDTLNEEAFLENEYPKFNTLCETIVGKPFAEVANNHPQKIGLWDMSSEVKKVIHDTQRKCIAECTDSLNKSTLSAAYCTDTSLCKMERLRKAQYYEPPDKSKHKKKHFALQSHKCTNFDELNRRIKEWDKSMGITATDLVKEFDIKGSDAAHKVKLLAMELNPTIPGLEIKSKPKSTKKRLAGSTLFYACPS